jgi:hypothetical protein
MMNKTSSLAKGGMYTALSLIMIYFANILPTSKLTFLAIAASIIPLSILTTDIKNSVAVFAATSILSLLLGLRGAAITYALFFGLYGFVKYFIEKLRKLPLELAIKLIFFNISFFSIYFIYKAMFLDIPVVKLPLYLIIIVLEIAFIAYDYVMSIIITYINNRFVK